MKKPGELEPEYILARLVLLNTLNALGGQREAVTLVGAQAIYVLCGETEIAVAPFTRDADIAIDPSALRAEPKIDAALRGAGFVPHPEQVGRWMGSGSVPVDLLVPASLGGSGRRAARLGPHGQRTARKVHGLEGALVDFDQRTIAALEPTDTRVFGVKVAGPAALLVAKILKLTERTGDPDRLHDKDALDIFRLLRVFETEELATRFSGLLTDQRSSMATKQGISGISDLFSHPDARGPQMAARAVEGVDDPEVVAASCAALGGDLLRALGHWR